MIENVINFLKQTFPNGVQMFDCQVYDGDSVVLLYLESRVKIYWCRYWEYIEIFGVSEEEFDQIDLEVNKSCLK